MKRQQAHRSEPLNWTQLLVAVGSLTIVAFLVVLGLWIVLSLFLSALPYVPSQP